MKYDDQDNQTAEAFDNESSRNMFLERQQSVQSQWNDASEFRKEKIILNTSYTDTKPKMEKVPSLYIQN